MTPATKAVAERETPKLPDLVRTPAFELTAEDVALPRLYIGQFMSKAVQDQLVKAGQIFSATGQDDPDPQVLWSPGDEGGVVFHVLTIRKGKSLSDGGDLQLWDYDDPAAHAEAWVTYNYIVAIPSVDQDVPFKLLLTRTGRPAALQINTVIKKNVAAGPVWINAFQLTAAARENTKGKFFVARVASIPATAEQVTVAETLGIMMNSTAQVEHSATGEQPAI